MKINLTQEQKDLILNSKSIDEVEKNAITVKNEIDAEVKELLLKEAREAAIKALEEFASIFDIELVKLNLYNTLLFLHHFLLMI